MHKTSLLFKTLHKITHLHTHFPSFGLSACINPAAIRADVELVCSADNRHQNINTNLIFTSHNFFFFLFVSMENTKVGCSGFEGEKKSNLGIQSRKVLVPVFIFPSFSTLQVVGNYKLRSWTNEQWISVFVNIEIVTNTGRNLNRRKTEHGLLSTLYSNNRTAFS